MTTHPADTDIKVCKGLWALHLTANRRKHIQPLLPIHITNAALPQTLASATGRSVVRLRNSGAHAGDNSSMDGSCIDGFILVSLLGGRTEQAALDFYLEGSQSYTFEVVGDNDVFLAGNMLGTAVLSTHSQPFQRASNGDTTDEITPQTPPIQQTGEKRDILSSTSSAISTSSETSNATVIPVKANLKDLDKVDFSELNFYDIREGNGEVVESGNRVSVYYTVIVAQTDTYIVQWLPGSNRPPHQFDVGSRSVVQGFNQGIVGMREGSMREIYIPCVLAYGPKGVSKVPPNSDLIIRCALTKVDPADF